MLSPWRWVVASVVVIGGIAAACSSSDDGKPTGPVVVEVARKQVGAAGGQVSGGGATIDIPEGAVDDGTEIIINQLDAKAANLPRSSVLAGAVYSLLPDNVEFKKPVTVRLQIDPAKKPADGLGSLVIFRAPANTNDWTVRGATGIQGNEVVAKTTHFSWWAPAVAGDTSCFHNRCRLDAGTAREMPEFPGMNCYVPGTGDAVHCKGAGPNDSTPYECGCVGTDTVLGTFERPPTETEISALATQCKGACPPEVKIPCSISVVCGGYEPATGDPSPLPGPTPGWTCKTTTAPFPMRCSHVPGTSQGFCYCDKTSKAGALVIPLNGISPPTDDEILLYWTDACGGDCNPSFGNQSSSGGVGPGSSGGPPVDPCIPQNGFIPGRTQCFTSASCYGDTYGATCTPTSGDPTKTEAECECRMNTGITKKFTIASCANESPQSLADKCSFPAPGDGGTPGPGAPDAGPDTGSPPEACLFGNPILPDGPNGMCTVIGEKQGPGGPGGACSKNQKAVCSGMDAGDGMSVCDCIENNAIVKTVNALCLGPGQPDFGVWKMCGWLP